MQPFLQSQSRFRKQSAGTKVRAACEGGQGMELRRWLGAVLAVTACGTVDPGPLDPDSTLSIREVSLPARSSAATTRTRR